MTEEVKEVVAEVVKLEVPELSASEVEAVEAGWQTKEDWIAAGKEESDWRPAKEFTDRGELFRKIDALATELKTTRSTMAALKGHYEKVKETEFKRALETLKIEKRTALENGDVDAIIEIDDKIADVKDTQKLQEKTEVVQPEIHPDFTNWVTKNTWYSTNKEMQAFADSIGRAYAVNTPGIDPATVLKYVTIKVKQAYPEKFVNPNRSAPGATEGANAPRKSKADESFELTADEERVMTKLVRQKVMTKEQYIAEIKAYKGKA